MSDYDCQGCAGKGKHGLMHLNRGDQPHQWVDGMECRDCAGTGRWTAARMTAWKAGQEYRRARVDRSESIFAAARRLGLGSAELSSIERGAKPMPDVMRADLAQSASVATPPASGGE